MSDQAVVVADDHDLYRMGLCQLIEHTEGLRVLAEVQTGTELQRLLKDEQPDLLILDHNMPGLSGLEIVSSIARTSRSIKTLIVTAMESPELMRDYINNGATGIILKTDSVEIMQNAVNTVARGEQYFSGSVEQLLAQKNLLAVLSSRERLVLRHIANGKTNKDIAVEMGLSPKTIDNHRTRLMAKLDIHNAADLVRFAFEAGIR